MENISYVKWETFLSDEERRKVYEKTGEIINTRNSKTHILKNDSRTLCGCNIPHDYKIPTKFKIEYFNKNSNYFSKSKVCENCLVSFKKIKRIKENEINNSEDTRFSCKTSNEKEKINHPSHYNTGKIEVIDFIEDQQLNFNLGNAIKYICRAKHKGTEIEDLKKAKWYLEREINGKLQA